MSAAPKQAHASRPTRFCHKCAQVGHTSRQCLVFKTRRCKYFYRGHCNKPSPVCMYAHSDQELRPSCTHWCTRIVYENGRRTMEGCGNPGHTIEHCHLHRDTGVWIQPQPPAPDA